MEYTSTMILVLSVVVLIAALVNPLPTLSDAGGSTDPDRSGDPENSVP